LHRNRGVNDFSVYGLTHQVEPIHVFMLLGDISLSCEMYCHQSLLCGACPLLASKSPFPEVIPQLDYLTANDGFPC